ncbi:hypothetical protein T09_8420 [Trichinella sp. T9]|nr:hypothetical protein T09_8420 [Trichinella sp. T9]
MPQATPPATFFKILPCGYALGYAPGNLLKKFSPQGSPGATPESIFKKMFTLKLQPDLRLRRFSKNSQEIHVLSLAYKFLLLILLIPIDNPNTGWLQC